MRAGGYQQARARLDPTRADVGEQEAHRAQGAVVTPKMSSDRAALQNISLNKHQFPLGHAGQGEMTQGTIGASGHWAFDCRLFAATGDAFNDDRYLPCR